MKKIKAVFLILVGVAGAYLILIAGYPALVDMVSSANTALPADMSAYPGGREALTSAPWYLFFVPAVLGVGALVWVLKSKD